MLAALIATRGPAPPKPPVFFYNGQLPAATNTFVCMTVCRRAAFITTSLPIRYQLSLSLPGAESLLDHLNRLYRQIIDESSSAANLIDQPIDLYLSDRIANVIALGTTLAGILATLPVAVSALPFRARLQLELATALANLRALGTIVN